MPKHMLNRNTHNLEHKLYPIMIDFVVFLDDRNERIVFHCCCSRDMIQSFNPQPTL